MKKLQIGVLAMSIAVAAAVAIGATGHQKESSVASELNAIAVQRMQEGDYKAAILKFEEALAVDPDCLDAIHNLGKILIIGGRYEEAEKLLMGGLKRHPDDVGCMVPLAQVYALNGRSLMCRALLDKISFADDKTLLPGLSLLLLKQGSIDDALVAADKALLQNPADAERWFNKGTILEALEKWLDASKCYKKAVALNSAYMAAWLNLGNMHERLNDKAEMKACYEKAYELDGSNPTVQYNLGRVLVRDGETFDRGLELLQSATKGSDAGAAAARKLLYAMIASVEGK